MRVTVHLREGTNSTNVRSEAIGTALESEGVTVEYLSRGTAPKDSDLVVQTGFAKSVALDWAIEHEVPYLIMEAPHFRGFYDVHTASSWGYNGLAGGAWRPTPPDEARPAPELLPMKDPSLGDLIIGQKPTDHSLRGSDHVDWIVKKRNELPEADFRPHPLMVPHGSLRPLREALAGYGRVFTYSSTVGTDALLEGCHAFAESDGSLLRHYRGDREEYRHYLSWGQAPHSEYKELVGHILGGYDEARDRMQRGLREVPRGRIDGQAVCERYYKLCV